MLLLVQSNDTGDGFVSIFCLPFSLRLTTVALNFLHGYASILNVNLYMYFDKWSVNSEMDSDLQWTQNGRAKKLY